MSSLLKNNMKKTADKNINLLPHEVLEKIAQTKATKTRISILKNNSSFALKTILQANFRDDIKFDIPEGTPPYKPDEGITGNQLQHIDKAITTLKHLLTTNKSIENVKKESMFINLLETVHAKDAKILIAMKDKTLRELYPGLTENIVEKAYPNLKIS